MDFNAILDVFSAAYSWAPIVLTILGSLVVGGTIVDKLVPDEKDNGFMTKLYNYPILGTLLKALVRFSVFSSFFDVEQITKK
jgi:hypothetical protein